MTFLVMTALIALVLLGVERLFRLGKRGRTALSLVYLTWTLVDAIWTAHENSGHGIFAFTMSFLDSVAPLVLWQWASAWIRQSIERRRSKSPIS
jgi:hypothetical protein